MGVYGSLFHHQPSGSGLYTHPMYSGASQGPHTRAYSLGQGGYQAVGNAVVQYIEDITVGGMQSALCNIG